MCLAPVGWMPEKTRIEVTSRRSWSRWVHVSGRGGSSAGLRLARGAMTNRSGRRRSHLEDRAKAATTLDLDDSHACNLVARLLAGADGPSAARMARAARRRGCRRTAEGEPAARLRGRGARPPRQPREGDRRAGVPAPGRRLRRVVQRDLDDADPREAEDHAADVRRPHLRRDAAGREGGADRGPVHEAALGAVRAGRRRGDPELPRSHGPRRRPHRRGARSPTLDGWSRVTTSLRRR